MFPTPSVKSLVWNIESTGNRIGPTSISWVANGKTVWTKSIPKPLRFTIFDDGWAGKSKDWLAKQRDEDGYAKYWAIETLPGAIAIGDNGTLLVLDVADGRTLFEQTIDLDRGNSFSGALIDTGDIKVTGKATCKLHVRKQNFVFACGDVLVAYDRGFASVIDTKSWKLVEKVEWRGPTSDELRGDCPGLLTTDVDRTKKVGGWTIHAKGVRQTICMR